MVLFGLILSLMVLAALGLAVGALRGRPLPVFGPVPFSGDEPGCGVASRGADCGPDSSPGGGFRVPGSA